MLVNREKILSVKLALEEMAKEEDVGKLVKIHSDLMAKFQDLTSRGLALVKEIGILKQVVRYLTEF